MISVLMFGFLWWSSSWWWRPHIAACKLCWSLLRPGEVVLDHLTFQNGDCKLVYLPMLWPIWTLATCFRKINSCFGFKTEASLMSSGSPTHLLLEDFPKWGGDPVSTLMATILSLENNSWKRWSSLTDKKSSFFILLSPKDSFSCCFIKL